MSWTEIIEKFRKEFKGYEVDHFHKLVIYNR